VDSTLKAEAELSFGELRTSRTPKCAEVEKMCGIEKQGKKRTKAQAVVM
jgi:hypothetical protein